MKNNFSLDTQRLIGIRPIRSDRLQPDHNSTFKLESKETQEGSYSNDLNSLVDIGLKKCKEMGFIRFLEKHELLFTQGLGLDWQQRHRVSFVNEVYKRYIMTLIERKVKESRYENNMYLDRESTKRKRGRASMVSDDIWTSMYIDKFMEEKRLNTEERLIKLPFIMGIAIEASEENLAKANEYFLNSFDMNDITFSEVKTTFHDKQMFIGMSGSEIKNYILLTAPFKYEPLGELDFESVANEIKTIQNYIEKDFLRS